MTPCNAMSFPCCLLAVLPPMVGFRLQDPLHPTMPSCKAAFCSKPSQLIILNLGFRNFNLEPAQREGGREPASQCGIRPWVSICLGCCTVIAIRGVLVQRPEDLLELIDRSVSRSCPNCGPAQSEDCVAIGGQGVLQAWSFPAKRALTKLLG